MAGKVSIEEFILKEKNIPTKKKCGIPDKIEIWSVNDLW